MPMMSARLGVLLMLCSYMSAHAQGNGVLATYFPTNISLGDLKSVVASNRPAAVDSPINLSGTNIPSPKMLESMTTGTGLRGIYWFHFVDSRVRAVTSSLVASTDTNSLFAQIQADSFALAGSAPFLRWAGAGTNLTDMTVTVWETTNSTVRLCAGVFTNETTLVLFDSQYFSVSNFFVSASQKTEMEGVLNSMQGPTWP